MTVAGFASHDPKRGFRARCVHGCSWLGPFRGLTLSQVQVDAENHAKECKR